MRTLYLLTLLLVLNTAAIAQKIRFTDSTNKFGYLCYNADGCYFNLYLEYRSDTFCFGQHYLPVTSSYRSHFCGGSSGAGFNLNGYFVREDTLLNKVFVLQDTTEKLLYDYNLHVGDTISYTPSSRLTLIDSVISIDSTLINGVYHKVFNFSSCERSPGPRSYKVVEGLGCMRNPFYVLYGACFEGDEQLVCFQHRSSTPAAYIEAPMCFGTNYFNNSCNFTLGADQPAAVHDAGIAVHPVPAKGEVTISLPTNNSNTGTLLFYNVLGELIDTQAVDDKLNIKVVNTELFADGLYVVVFCSEGGRKHYQRLTIQH
jgi:hypothetical protein